MSKSERSLESALSHRQFKTDIMRAADASAPAPQTQIDEARDYRRALGGWATGVAVATARDGGGRSAGLTINSFASVSLEPPLVAWSLARTSSATSIFRNASHWCVHVLAEGQEELSRRFATPMTDKFSGVDMSEGIGGAPLFKDFLARFQCRHWRRYDGGDHVMLVGLVQRYDWNDLAPLVYWRGYRSLTATSE